MLPEERLLQGQVNTRELPAAGFSTAHGRYTANHQTFARGGR
jgi:hypothetical protein